MKKVILFFSFLILSTVVFAQGEPAPDVGGIPISTILTIIFGGLAVLAGGFWGVAKGKIGEVSTLLTIIVNALDDNAISDEELKKIIAQAKKIVNK